MHFSLWIFCWMVSIVLLQTRACPLSSVDDDQGGDCSEIISQPEGGARSKRDVDAGKETDDEEFLKEQMRVLFPLLKTIIISAERSDPRDDATSRDEATSKDNVDCGKTAAEGERGGVDNDYNEEQRPAIHILIPMLSAPEKKASPRTVMQRVPAAAKADGFQLEKE